MKILHVIPIGDSGPSVHDALLSCWCHPTRDENVVVHNAHDLREKYERQGLPQQPWLIVGGPNGL